MTIIKCDKCGETANGKYYGAGACGSFHNEPYVIILKEGTNKKGEQFCEDRKAVRWELCKKCFEGIKENIERFPLTKPDIKNVEKIPLQPFCWIWLANWQSRAV